MVARTIAEILDDHVTLEVEAMDRIYLNAYQPQLQTGGGVVAFFKGHRGATVASTTLMAPMSRAFVRQIEQFAREQDLDLIRFAKGERKDDITHQYLRRFDKTEGVLYIGKAQEKFSTFRVHKRFSAQTHQAFPWLIRSTVMCNQYYFYLVDEDFGPLFIKFSGYFPYTARVCLNGHEYAKKQLEKEGIAYEALDNGLLSCDNPQRLQHILAGLDAAKIETLVRKWFSRLPHPFTAQDRLAGFRYELSLLQVEFALTQVLDRPLCGRYLFEELIRENLDLGRPDQVSLIFDRRVTKTTPGRFRTRIITQGVIPSLHISYKYSKIKQYYKEGRALRTETTINNTRDFGIGRRLKNLPAVREIGFKANRRLLQVQTISQDCRIAEQTFERVTRPRIVNGQRAGALKFADQRVMALLQALALFCLVPGGFRNASLRELVAQLLGITRDQYTPGSMTYDLRRLRLHGLIEKIPHTQRYQVTDEGMKISLFFTKVHARVIRGGLAQINDGFPSAPNRQLACAMNRLNKAIDEHIQAAKLAA